MAERLTAAVSNAGSADSTPAPEVSSAPAEVSPASTATAPEPVASPAPGAPVADADPGLTFDDDPPELNFDEPEAPAPAPVAEQTQAAPPATEDAFDGLLPKQVENAFLKTNRGRNLLATYKTFRELKAEPMVDPATGQNTGGLGFMPTVEQVREFHQAHSDMMAMQHEFVENPESFVTNWFAPDARGQFRPGAEQALVSIPSVLNDAYAQAEQRGNQALSDQVVGVYRKLLAPMATAYAEGLYSRANDPSVAPEQREQLINAARLIESDMTGKVRPDDALKPSAAPDPVAAKLAEIEQREQRLLSWQQKNATDQQKQVESQIFSTIDQNLTADVEKALASVRTALPARAYKAAVEDLKREVQKAVQQNQDAFRKYNFSLTAARRSTNNAGARLAPVENYRAAARIVIQNRFRTWCQELADGAVRQNAQTRATAATAAAQTAPAVNGGQAPPQSVVPQPTRIVRQEGETQVDYNKRRLDAVLGRDS